MNTKRRLIKRASVMPLSDGLALDVDKLEADIVGYLDADFLDFGERGFVKRIVDGFKEAGLAVPEKLENVYQVHTFDNGGLNEIRRDPAELLRMTVDGRLKIDANTEYLLELDTGDEAYVGISRAELDAMGEQMCRAVVDKAVEIAQAGDAAALDRFAVQIGIAALDEAIVQQ